MVRVCVCVRVCIGGDASRLHPHFLAPPLSGLPQPSRGRGRGGGGEEDGGGGGSGGEEAEEGVDDEEDRRIFWFEPSRAPSDLFGVLMARIASQPGARLEDALSRATPRS